jgi:iron(III) transport system substrate-binding protein
MQMLNGLRAFVAIAALAAPLTAAAQGEVVVYCTVQEEWCRPMVAAFEKATGIKVLMTRKSSGEFYAQLKAEAANPRGDIWWGGTGDPHLQAAEEGLTEAYKSPRMGELQDWAVRQWESSKGRTVGVYAGALGYSYNHVQLKNKNLAAPKCWSDLSRP